MSYSRYYIIANYSLELTIYERKWILCIRPDKYQVFVETNSLYTL